MVSGSFIQHSKNLVNWFFLLSDKEAHLQTIPHWRVSALRIFLFCTFLVCVVAAFSTFNKAVELNLLYILTITIGFSTLVIGLLVASHYYYKVSANLFLVSVVLAGTAINIFTISEGLGQLGYILIYSCPAIALLLLGRRAALFYALMNIVPFYLLVNNIDLSYLFGTKVELASAGYHINSVVFVFFNVCIPLGLIRTIVAAKRINEMALSANNLLKDKNSLYRNFFTNSENAKIIVDDKGGAIDCNKKAIELFSTIGVDTTSPVPQELLQSIYPPSSDENKAIIQYRGSYLRVNHHPVAESEYFVYELTDCTDEQMFKKDLSLMEQENKRLRYSDGVMKLPNKCWFEKQTERFILKSHDVNYMVVLQNTCNEYLRLKYGEKIVQISLVNAYKQLKNNFKGILLPAYVGSGQLAFIVSNTSKLELERTLLVKIKPELDAESPLPGTKYQQSFKFGFASFDESESFSQTLANAQTAINHTDKYQHISTYNQQLSQSILEKHEISILLDEALQNAELEMHYQPKVSCRGECIGFEALARWNSPIIGWVSPAIFIPIAEEHGMINRLTDFVMLAVCEQISKWKMNGAINVPVAMNISFVDLDHDDFIPKLLKNLTDFNIKPEQIEIEITETALATSKGYSGLIKSLQSWGFIISIDDFGVGYSNLSRIAEYPIDKLKIDRSLISQLTSSSRKRALVNVIHGMCKELGITCIAEGVETPEQVAIMTDMGCKEFQGFYFSKPLSPEALSKYIDLNFYKTK